MGTTIQAVHGLVPNKLRADYRPLYDYSNLTAAAIGLNVTFFQTPVGGSKGLELTNLYGKGFELPNPEMFDAYAMRIIIIGALIVDIEGILKNYCFSFFVSGKLRWQGKADYYQAGAGIAGAAVTTVAATTLQAWSNGQPGSQAVAHVPGNYMVRIGTGEQFRVEMTSLTGYTITQACQLGVLLEGVYYSAV